MIDDIDRAIINRLQNGLPICTEPYAEVAAQLGISEEALLTKLQQMLDKNVLTRFGPMYNAERMGGGLTLAAMSIPKAELDHVARQVNAFPEVAHNYERDHLFNMWFVLATETRERIGEVICEMEQLTGYPVYNMPKLQEFFLGMRFDA